MNKTENQDKVIICCDCGDKFVFEKGEQLFYEQRGFLPPRLTCPPKTIPGIISQKGE